MQFYGDVSTLIRCRGNLKSSTFRQPAAKQIKLVFHAIKPFMLEVHYNILDLCFLLVENPAHKYSFDRQFYIFQQ